MMFSPPVVAPRPHPRVVETAVDDSRVLLHLDDRRLHFLNGTASAIWAELGDSATIGELTVRLADRFEVDPSIVRPDVEKLLTRLRVDGLVTVDDRFSEVTVPTPGHRSMGSPGARSFRALRANVMIECDDPEVMSTITGILAPLLSDEPPDMSIRVDVDASGRWFVTAGDDESVMAGSRLAAVLRAVSEVNNLAVASVPERLVLHAGAVSGPAGTIVMPAASNSGKSTLTTALVSAGLGYLSDEVAAIGTDLFCMPYPKAIALDPGSFQLFPGFAPEGVEGLDMAVSTREWHVDSSLVGQTSDPAPVVGIVCPKWRPGAETRLCRVPPAEALQLLLGEAFDFAAGGQAVFDILGHLVRDIPVYRLGYGRLNEAVATVRQILEVATQPAGVVGRRA